MITVYGLKNCDTCKKVLKAVAGQNLAHVFVDIRAEADLSAKVPGWLNAAGSKFLLNTRSTTWRNLSDDDKAQAETAPASLLIANPTLIKRPVIEMGDDIHVGWTTSVQGDVLGASA